jgi:Methyltransferase domain
MVSAARRHGAAYDAVYPPAAAPGGGRLRPVHQVRPAGDHAAEPRHAPRLDRSAAALRHRPSRDETIRQPLEEVDPKWFDQLSENDILLIDSSHRAFQNSDVTMFFLDVLPRLAPGVIVHVHDIYLPYDYLAAYLEKLWNEQYLLATALLYGGAGLEILFPCWYATQDPDLSSRLGAGLRRGRLSSLYVWGVSFWLRKS